MSTADWDIHGPSDRVWTPEELAQIARAAQAFQAALPTADGATFHLVTLHGLGVIGGEAEVTWPQPGEPASVSRVGDPQWAWGVCPCGHLWMRHDVEEYRGDGSETCCVDGCDQAACPGKNRPLLPDAIGPGWPRPDLRQGVCAACHDVVLLDQRGLIVTHGIGPCPGTGYGPVHEAPAGVCDSCQTEQAVIDGIVVSHNFERDGQRHRCSGSGGAPSKDRA